MMNSSFDINGAQSLEDHVCNAAQKKKGVETIRYLTSFVDKAGFENKQFDRYVAKVKDMLRDLLPGFLPERMHAHSTDLMLFQMLVFYHTPFESESMKKDVTNIYKFMHEYMIRAEKLNFAEKLTSSEFKTEDLIETLGVEVEIYCVKDYIAYELRSACKEFIRKKSALNSNVDKSSYFSTLPKNQIELLEIVQNTLNWTTIDIERSIRSDFSEALVSSKKDEFVNELTDKISNLQNELKEKALELQEMKNVVIGLSAKVSVSNQKCVECTSDKNEYIEALKRENQKLKARYNDLFDKYKSAYGEAMTQNDDIGESLTLPELDTSKRYLFVVGEEITFQSKLSEAFPNSSFTSKIQSISQMDIECVIAITSCIDHSVYYGMKNQCKSQNVPFIHCEHSNVELIKQLLLNALY